MTSSFSAGIIRFDCGSVVIIPQYNLPLITSVSYDVAMRLYKVYRGTELAIVAVNNPSGVMPAVRKVWLSLIRQLRNDKSRTLSSVRITELAHDIERMESMQFAIGWPSEGIGVAFIEPAELGKIMRRLVA